MKRFKSARRIRTRRCGSTFRAYLGITTLCSVFRCRGLRRLGHCHGQGAKGGATRTATAVGFAMHASNFPRLTSPTFTP